MAQGDRATLGGLVCATPAVTIAVQGWNVSTQINEIIESNGGEVDPRLVAVMDSQPRLSFTTHQLTVLSSFGIAGAQITTLEAYITKLANYGTRTAGSTHTKVAIATGLCVPRTLSVSQGQAATLAMEAIAISTDGATAPVVATASQALPAAAAGNEVFTLGPVKINNTAVDVESVTVDFGLSLHVESSEGQPYPTLVAIMARQPSIRLGCKSIDVISNLGLSGVAYSAATHLYFRKIAAGGTRVTDITAAHVKISINGGMISVTQPSAENKGRFACEVLITPIYDGSNPIMTVATAIAIT